MSDIGFTGTQRGWTKAQEDAVREFLLGRALHDTRVFRHGDCVGSDEQGAELAMELFYRVVSYPPKNPVKRAYADSHEVREPAPYLERDHNIVDDCQEVLATPAQRFEILRSGTWATIRYARKIGKRVTVIYPDGSKEVTPS